jgi:hypothetical protein
MNSSPRIVEVELLVRLSIKSSWMLEISSPIVRRWDLTAAYLSVHHHSHRPSMEVSTCDFV